MGIWRFAELRIWRWNFIYDLQFSARILALFYIVERIVLHLFSRIEDRLLQRPIYNVNTKTILSQKYELNEMCVYMVSKSDLCATVNLSPVYPVRCVNYLWCFTLNHNNSYQTLPSSNKRHIRWMSNKHFRITKRRLNLISTYFHLGSFFLFSRDYFIDAIVLCEVCWELE